MKKLVIGCGNVYGGDDAAGPMVARRLRELGLEAREHGGEGLDLIECWRGTEDVILVDAVITGAEPGTVTVWDVHSVPVETGWFRCSSHTLGVGEALRLARALGRLPARIRVYGIEAVRFEPGAGLTPAVAAAVEQAARMIADEVSKCTNLP